MNTRSYNMSRIHGKDTKPEEIVRKYLFKQGFRYRKNDCLLPGTPDVVFPKYNTCIFINGCFWHVHEDCRQFVWPKSNKEFWQKKLLSNVERDKKNYQKLVEKGWRVIIIWGCELNKSNFEKRMNQLVDEITTSKD